jgi:hypothetical protein
MKVDIFLVISSLNPRKSFSLCQLRKCSRGLAEAIRARSSTRTHCPRPLAHPRFPRQHSLQPHTRRHLPACAQSQGDKPHLSTYTSPPSRHSPSPLIMPTTERCPLTTPPPPAQHNEPAKPAMLLLPVAVKAAQAPAPTPSRPRGRGRRPPPPTAADRRPPVVRPPGAGGTPATAPGPRTVGPQATARLLSAIAVAGPNAQFLSE